VSESVHLNRYSSVTEYLALVSSREAIGVEVHLADIRPVSNLIDHAPRAIYRRVHEHASRRMEFCPYGDVIGRQAACP
jgi:hypothetical protein